MTSEGLTGRNRDFNPHTREGCDNGEEGLCQDDIDFNPHTREGCDVKTVMEAGIEIISIHTPAKGVTVFICLRSKPG